MKAFVAAASCLLIASPVFGQYGTSSPGAGIGARDVIDRPQGPNSVEAGSGVGVAASDGPLICRRVEIESSSRMATRRLCLTARKWRERQARR